MINENDKLGLDFGGVINGLTKPNNPKSIFGERYLESPESPGLYKYLPRIVQAFGGRVYIVSTCGSKIAQRTTEWIDYNDLEGKANLSPKNVRYVAKRAYKADICQELGITHFVDDHFQVLNFLLGKVPNLYIFHPSQTEMGEFPEVAKVATPVQSWRQLCKAILFDH